MKKSLYVFLCSVGVAASVSGAGFGLYEVDAGSMAFGGHVIGRPRNASAVYFNPAAMSGMTGTCVSATLTLTRPYLDTKIDDSRGHDMEPGWFMLPAVFVTTELPCDFRFGFGCFADFGLGSKYSKRWELKHDSTETLFEGYTLQAVISRNITEKWSLGVGPRLTLVNFETEMVRDFAFVDQMYLAQSGGMMHAPVRGKNRLRLHANNYNRPGLGLAAGTQYRFTDDFAVGVMYRSRIRTKLTGHTNWDGDDLERRNPASDSMELPAQVSIGFNWDNCLGIEGLHFGASAAWIEWSKMTRFQFDVYNPVSRQVEENNIRLDWRNTYRVGCGFAYDITDSLQALCGYVYDWDPCRNRLGNAHTMLPLGDRHVASTGLSWTSSDGHWEVSLGYSCVIMESKTQSIPDEYYQYNHKIYNFHSHNSFTHMISFGVAYHF